MFKKLFEWLKDFFSKTAQEESKHFKALLEECSELHLEKDAIINQLKMENEELTFIIDDSSFISEQEDYWNNKYPTANIDYLGRTFGTSKKRIPIDVRLLITPQDFKIHDILKKKNLYYDGEKTISSMDDHIIKIYHFIKNNYYKYVFDDDNYGITEYWEFPFEILEGLNNRLADGFDCDSWANFIASFLIASGVPNWKVRVVVGGSKAGGHSTVYCHSDVTNSFHHINSTYGTYSNLKKLHEYPISDDALADDYLGIKDVWFSFNDKFAWHEFTSAAKKDYKEEAGKELYKIKKV